MNSDNISTTDSISSRYLKGLALYIPEPEDHTHTSASSRENNLNPILQPKSVAVLNYDQPQFHRVQCTRIARVINGVAYLSEEKTVETSSDNHDTCSRISRYLSNPLNRPRMINCQDSPFQSVLRGEPHSADLSKTSADTSHSHDQLKASFESYVNYLSAVITMKDFQPGMNEFTLKIWKAQEDHRDHERTTLDIVCFLSELARSKSDFSRHCVFVSHANATCYIRENGITKEIQVSILAVMRSDGSLWVTSETIYEPGVKIPQNIVNCVQEFIAHIPQSLGPAATYFIASDLADAIHLTDSVLYTYKSPVMRLPKVSSLLYPVVELWSLLPEAVPKVGLRAGETITDRIRQGASLIPAPKIKELVSHQRSFFNRLSVLNSCPPTSVNSDPSSDYVPYTAGKCGVCPSVLEMSDSGLKPSKETERSGEISDSLGD